MKDTIILKTIIQLISVYFFLALVVFPPSPRLLFLFALLPFLLQWLTFAFFAPSLSIIRSPILHLSCPSSSSDFGGIPVILQVFCPSV